LEVLSLNLRKGLFEVLVVVLQQGLQLGIAADGISSRLKSKTDILAAQLQSLFGSPKASTRWT
jgi:hypothetical protein